MPVMMLRARPRRGRWVIMPPPLIGGALSDDAVWRLSVAYIGPKSRTERLRKTKIGTEVAHVTRDSYTTFKVKRSKVKVTRPLYSPRRLHIRQLQRWVWECIHRGNLLLRCRLQARRSARRCEALRRPQEGGEGRGISWRPPAYSLLVPVNGYSCSFAAATDTDHYCKVRLNIQNAPTKALLRTLDANLMWMLWLKWRCSFAISDIFVYDMSMLIQNGIFRSLLRLAVMILWSRSRV